MAWIEFHQELPRHPKTDVLMDELDVSRPTAVGLLGMGWIWAMEFAIDGFIAQNRVGAAARGAGWDGAPAAFAAAMVSAGWWDQVEDGYRVHDWEKYIGKLLEKRRQDAERKAASRGSAKDSPKPSKPFPKSVRRMSAGQDTDIPKLSEENPSDGSGKPTNHVPTNNPPSIPPSGGGESDDASPSEESFDTKGYSPEFEEAWQLFPQRAGGNSKKAAFKAWSARLKEGVTPRTLVDGLRRYRAFCEATGKIGTETVKMASTFFGPNEHYLEDWNPPGTPGGQSVAPPAAAEPPPAIDPERVRGVTRTQLLPLLNRAGWERDKALRYCAEAPVDELVAKLRELQGVRDGAA